MGCALLFINSIFGNKFFNGQLGPSHDNYYWTLSSFKHWYDGLRINEISFFDFYSNDGIPFGSLIIQLRFFDPIDLVITKILVFLKLDAISAFNIRFNIILIINSIFYYLFLQYFINGNLSRYLLFTILVSSSFLLSSYTQTGFILMYQWSGLTFFFFNKYYIEQRCDKKYLWLIIICFLLSNTLWGYVFTGISLIIICLFLVHIKNYKLFFKWKYIYVLFFIIPALPSIAIFSEKDNFIFPAREPNISIINGVESYTYSQFEPKSEKLIKSDIVQNYQVLKQTGVFGIPADFITLFSPKYNGHITPSDSNISGLNEGYFFYGILMVFFMPLGFLYFIKHKLKLSYVFILLVFFYLGPNYYFHQFIYIIFPPIWVFRHSTLVNLFLQSFLILFAIKGFDILYYVKDGINSKINYWFDPVKVFGYSIPLICLLAILLTFIFKEFVLGFTFWGAVVISLILFIALKKGLASHFIVIIFGFIVALNFIELLYQFINSKQIYSQEIQINDSKQLTDEERLNAVIRTPASLHSGCFYGNTWQAMRFPSILKNERSIYSPPVARNSNDIETHCETINTEEKIRTTDRWSSLLLYKSYYEDVINKDISLYEERKYLIPDPSQRERVYKVTQNAIYFANLPPSELKTNLYYDKNWRAYCDGVNLIIDINKMVELNLVHDCKDLKLEYYPKFFAMTLYAVIAYYVFFILIIAYLSGRIQTLSATSSNVENKKGIILK